VARTHRSDLQQAHPANRAFEREALRAARATPSTAITAFGLMSKSIIRIYTLKKILCFSPCFLPAMQAVVSHESKDNPLLTEEKSFRLVMAD